MGRMGWNIRMIPSLHLGPTAGVRALDEWPQQTGFLKERLYIKASEGGWAAAVHLCICISFHAGIFQKDNDCTFGINIQPIGKFVWLGF